MKNRRDLLNCAQILTNNQVGSERSQISYQDLNEMSLQEMLSYEKGWAHFQSVFMVSGLTGDGVGDIQVIIINACCILLVLVKSVKPIYKEFEIFMNS